MHIGHRDASRAVHAVEQHSERRSDQPDHRTHSGQGCFAAGSFHTALHRSDRGAAACLQHAEKLFCPV